MRFIGSTQRWGRRGEVQGSEFGEGYESMEVLRGEIWEWEIWEGESVTCAEGVGKERKDEGAG